MTDGDGRANPGETDVIDPLILARGLHLSATALAAGTIAFATLVADGGEHLRRQFAVLTWAALAAAVGTGAAWLLLLAADVSDEPGAAWTLLSETRFGWVACARFGMATALAVLILSPRARWLTLALAAAFIAAPALIGHAGAAPDSVLPLMSDIVHLLAAGAWLGGLPALVLLLGSAAADKASAVRRFGGLALASVLALAISGLTNARTFLASPGDLIATDYGRVLSAKLALFVALLGFGAVNRFRLTPRAGEPASQRALHHNCLAEAALGFVVLMLVGWLGTLPPPAHRHAPSEIPPDAAFVHIHDGTAMADLTITPGRVGPAKATIRLSRENGDEFPANGVRLALDPPANTARPIDQPAQRQPDGSWIVQRLEIGQSGNWMVRVLVTPATGPLLVLDAPVVIER